MSAPLSPATSIELADMIRAAAAKGEALEIRGGGTKAGLGRPTNAAAVLGTARLSGITLYEPAEMVISARAGTPLAEIEAALSAKGQTLPFEPAGWTALLGARGAPTIGGIVAAGVSGPRRIAAGACRDALIGVKFVNGRGEEVVSGGRVMKNVTGYDLVKLQAGAHGTLGVLTEVTFKVLPAPPSETTLAWDDLDEARAVRLLCEAMGTPFEISGAAHLPARHDAPARTCLRLEHFPDSLDYRAGRLIAALREHGAPRRLGAEESRRLWREVREVAPFHDAPGRAIWRLSTAPTRGAGLVARLRETMNLAALYDWSGGLVWLAVPEAADAGAGVIRAALRAVGGHATLMRASEGVRAAIPPFEPPPEAAMRLTRGLKAAFDPAGVLNPGRMYAGV